MAIEIKMPALSPTMEEGTLSKWLIAEGDDVRSGDVIAEIEPDKATMEVEAIEDGKIGQILIVAGTQNVKVNAPIALLLEDGEIANPGTYHRVKGEWQLAAQAPPPVKKVYVGRSSTPYTAPDSKIQDRHHEYFFGHLGMCLNETRGVTIIALTMCKAAELSRAEWVEICDLHEEFGAAVYAAAKKESRQKQQSNEEGSKRRLASMIREHNSEMRGVFSGI